MDLEIIKITTSDLTGQTDTIIIKLIKATNLLFLRLNFKVRFNIKGKGKNILCN